MSTKIITIEEIRKHNNKDDLWTIIDNKVYDLTKFRNEHPGGEETLDEAAGKDSTSDFNDVGHSSDAKLLMKKYYIGDVNQENLLSRLPREFKVAAGALVAGFAIVIIVKKFAFTRK